MAPAIEIQNLVVEFPGRRAPVRALQDLTLAVEEGQVFGFLGPNGAGKTTTMHVLLGFILATSGVARVFGTDVREAIARRRIGYLPEHPDTYRFLTGRELLTVAGHLFLMRGAALRRRIDVLAEEVGLGAAIERRIAGYSRGMLQRLGLAQALIQDPDLVILDEPTSGFDPLGRVSIRALIASLRERGKTVFFSSHELSEVELVCDHIGIVVNGRMVAGGTVAELAPAGERLEHVFLKVVTSCSAS